MYTLIFVTVCISFAVSLALAIILRRNFLIAAGLFFTIIADIFLVLTLSYFEIGLLFFIIVQLMYAANIYITRHGLRLTVGLAVETAIRIILSIITVIIAVQVLLFDWEIVLASIYAVNFVINLVMVFSLFRQKYLLAIGMLLFAFCDIFVGLLNLPYFTNAVINRDLIFALMAMCYIPSQIIIAVSTVHKKSLAQKEE